LLLLDICCEAVRSAILAPAWLLVKYYKVDGWSRPKGWSWNRERCDSRDTFPHVTWLSWLQTYISQLPVHWLIVHCC